MSEFVSTESFEDTTIQPNTLKSESKKEKIILKYLELTYCDYETFDNETSIGVNGVCIYYKISKQIGFTGVVHLDLVNWFGGGKYYYPELRKWFSNKFNVDVI